MKVTDEQAKAFWDRGLKTLAAMIEAKEIFYKYVLYEQLYEGLNTLCAVKIIEDAIKAKREYQCNCPFCQLFRNKR